MPATARAPFGRQFIMVASKQQATTVNMSVAAFRAAAHGQSRPLFQPS